MKPLLILALLAVALATGCGQSKSPATVAAKTNAPTARSESAAEVIAAPVNYLGAMNQAKKVAGKTVDSSTLNRAIQSFQAGEGRWPKDLSEIVKEGYMPKIPPPPNGMRYQYDPQSGALKITQ